MEKEKCSDKKLIDVQTYSKLIPLVQGILSDSILIGSEIATLFWHKRFAGSFWNCIIQLYPLIVFRDLKSYIWTIKPRWKKKDLTEPSYMPKGTLGHLGLWSVKMLLDLWNFCCLILASDFLLFCGCISPWGLSPCQLPYFLHIWQIFYSMSNVSQEVKARSWHLHLVRYTMELCNSALVLQHCATKPCRALLPWEVESHSYLSLASLSVRAILWEIWFWLHAC